MPRKSEWPKGAEIQKTAFSMPKKTLDRARIQAVHEGRTLQELVAQALEEYLRKARKEGRDGR